MKRIGKTFGDEIIAAGLGGIPFSGGDDGSFNFTPEITQTQKDAIMAVYAEHDPNAIPKDELEIADIKADTRFTNFRDKTKAQRKKMADDIVTLDDAKDVIKTLLIVVGVLTKRI